MHQSEIVIPEGHYLIEVDKFRTVWNYLKIRTPVEKFIDTYEGWEKIYKHERMTSMSLDELAVLRTVFFFKGDTIQQWRRQITDFIAKNKQFYHDTLEGMLELMREEINSLNEARAQENLFAIVHINLFPQYGGKLQDRKAASSFEKQMYKDNEAALPF